MSSRKRGNPSVKFIPQSSLDLSKKNGAVTAICVIVALLLMNDQFLLYKERASQQIYVGSFTDFTVSKTVVDPSSFPGYSLYFEK